MTSERFMEKMELKRKENEAYVQYRIALFTKSQYEKDHEDLHTDEEYKALRKKAAEAYLKYQEVRREIAQFDETSAKIDYLETI